MSLPGAAKARIETTLGAAVSSAERLGGGQIAAVWRVDLQDGRALVVKSGNSLRLEAWMLSYLKSRTKVPVPEVYLADDDLLAMEFIANDGGLSARAESRLGEITAELHAIAGEQFGFERDTLIGGLPQPNPPTDDWPAFFRDHRLLAMGRAALAAGRLPQRLMTRLEAAPSLVHGDLWAGNILSRGADIVGLIDPALYFADPEIELAFMTLFGSVGERFFSSYGERRTLRPGFFEERRQLYNLYPLLVHVRLFGGAYVAQVDRTLARYGF